MRFTPVPCSSPRNRGLFTIVAAGALLVGPAMAQAPPAAVAAPDSLATIDGVTFGADGLPLSGTTVWLANRANELVSRLEAASDAFGRFAFQNLAPGTYGLTASHAGYEDYRGSPITITAERPKAAILIKMVPLAVLSGRVTDEDGNPMPGVAVSARRFDLVENGRVRIGAGGGVGFKTGATGEYRLMVPSGHWYLSFEPPKAARPANETPSAAPAGHDEPEQDYVTTWYPGVPDSSLAAGLDAAAGQQIPELNLRLRKTSVFHVRGKVLGSVPEFSTKIVALRGPIESDADVVDEGQPLESDGTFDISGISAGEWVLVAVGAGGGFMEFGPAGRANVEVVNRDLENVVVVVRPLVDVHGSVKIVAERSAGNAPSLGLEVRLMPLVASAGGYWYMAAPVQSDGAFTLEKPFPGRYRVDATTPPGGFVKSVLFDGRECIDSGIDLSGEARLGLQITIGTTAGTITGTVTNPDGPLPAAATVTLIPDGPPTAIYRPELHPIVRADASGNFTVKNVVPGTYRVYAWERLAPVPELPLGEALAFADPGFPLAFTSMSVVVTVGEDESKHVSLSLISVSRMEEDSGRHR